MNSVRYSGTWDLARDGGVETTVSVAGTCPGRFGIGRRPPASAHQGLGQPFLEGLAVGVDKPALPGDDPAPSARPRLERDDPRDDLDGVAEGDRMKELPLQDGEERQGLDAGRMAGQARGDRQAEQAMRDRLAE